MRHELTPTMRTLYAELVQQVETAPAAGSVYRRARDEIEYYYAKVPVGAGRVDCFVGRVGDAVAESQADSLRRGMAEAKERRRIIAMLKSAGLAAPDRMLGAAMDAIAHAGLFRNGAVLVGTAAYLLSEPHVGRRLPAPTLMTGDLDLATVDVALTAEPPETMAEILHRADPTFEPVLQLDPRRPPSRFRNAEGFLVDLVIQTRQRGQANPVRLRGLDAGAAPLQHLAWLIENPVTAVALWGAGVLVKIPQPARFAVHKLILAQRRGPADRTKRGKDLSQADALMTALYASDPFALEDALEDARAQGRPGWSDPIDRSLAELARKDRGS
ncbi:MAG TPA: nucleotidyltransferase domain-containing protein [Allosphingosinicella sp.]|nr:nucleotidyltransferase domain-containing protein [Allosphingosinicella sp.]